MSRRTILVRREEHGRPLATVLQSRLQLSLSRVRRLIRQGGVRVAGIVCRYPNRQVRKGQQLVLGRDASVAPSRQRRRKVKGEPSRISRGPFSSTGIIIRHADQHIVVVDKPAGLTTVRHASEAAEFGKRGRRFLPPTLADFLAGELLRQRGIQVDRVRAVHRLDRDTTGLVVFACTPAAERHLGQQLRKHGVKRRYLALVRGKAATETIESFLVRDRGDGRRGSAPPLPFPTGEGKKAGQRAITHVRVLEELGNYTLVECRLETGRTHQVRIHLGERGTPLCGERIYDRPLHGAPYPDGSGARRPLLHAASLELEHPATGKWMKWRSPLPVDMKRVLEQLRRGDVLDEADGGPEPGPVN